MMHRSFIQRRYISKQAMTLRENVRKLDYDNFLCGLLLPNPSRDAFFAIRAFNIEIARVKDNVRTNPGAGKLRIQWWRQRIHDIFHVSKAPTDHALLTELHTAIHKHKLTKRWFDRILEAREWDLDIENPSTIKDLEVYAEKTAASLLHLTLECLDVRDDTADIAARNAGISIGITTLLRGTNFHASNKTVYLPQEVLTKHNLTPEEVIQAAIDDEAKDLRSKLTPAVFEVACIAVERLRQAQAAKPQIPRAAIPAFYTTVSSQRFLDRLESCNFDISNPDLHEARPLNLQLALLKHSLFRYY
ncbi:unnamed protein product [Aphanomyces euteiches]|uniref:15-cis-phytoene synthase n=1 Tax=Aphanomyces euteiches TaxID=100861 RepID=A0A6G0XYL1_9STRA|nr:hypothetical protein Ae201684_000161 [Aphanomyces euteiches]KAH9091630.1 hypothetical protein Ae201684P_011174 [Aphanomyces euteiches]KAH9136089.1 hypothetical protein AeRB84_018631 [Aphanomyces euteiches]